MSFDERRRQSYASKTSPRGSQRPEQPRRPHRFPVSSSTSTPSITQSSTASSQFSLPNVTLTRSTTSIGTASSPIHGGGFNTNSLYDIDSSWVLDDSRCGVRHRLALRHRQLLGPRRLAVTNYASTSSTPGQARDAAGSQMIAGGRGRLDIKLLGAFNVGAVNPVATPMSRRSAMAAHWLAQGPAARDDRGGALRKNAAIAPLPGTSSPLPRTAPITGRPQDVSL